MLLLLSLVLQASVCRSPYAWSSCSCARRRHARRPRPCVRVGVAPDSGLGRVRAVEPAVLSYQRPTLRVVAGGAGRRERRQAPVLTSATQYLSKGSLEPVATRLHRHRTCSPRVGCICVLSCNVSCMACKVSILPTHLPKVSHMGGIAAACGEGFRCARGMQDGDHARLEGVLHVTDAAGPLVGRYLPSLHYARSLCDGQFCSTLDK